MKMNKLRDCYNHLKDIFNNSEFSEIEPYASVELVEKYRQYWKPEQVSYARATSNTVCRAFVCCARRHHAAP